MLTYKEPLPRRPFRVVVAGVSGTGKTTLAGRIAVIIGAPHIEIDALYHGPNWVPRESFLDDVRSMVAQDSWTTEWQYRAARPLVTERADLVVWLDLPFWTTTLPRLVRRTLRRRLRREILWNGNTEPPLRTFFTDPDNIVRWAISTHFKYRAKILALETAAPHVTVVRLRSQREVERWLAGPLRCALDGNAL
ncbi:AAA family ATPase [Arthrobacter sp. NPDC056727]|uniref:AAA family ATPase n=1 Tax=Arthrobacter sp. NPDC056727 TaxID=3345927 RepID=UPI003671B0FF